MGIAKNFVIIFKLPAMNVKFGQTSRKSAGRMDKMRGKERMEENRGKQKNEE